MERSDYMALLDGSQRPVVEATGGYHLVLAPPGCGKTHILAERIRYAHEVNGVPYEDMLCLTFTNRAAREMTNRIHSLIDDDSLTDLMVGNVHRFCSRFLFDGDRVPADTSIIDDDEAMSIIADYKNEDEQIVQANYKASNQYKSYILFSHLMYQMEKGHPWEYFLHPECFTDADRMAIKQICTQQKMDYNEKSLIQIYHHAMDYMDDADAPRLDFKVAWSMRMLLWKMYYASCYDQYKRENHMLDFEDLLIKTYEIYRKDGSCKRYSWIQVDEVQDLNGLQLAIIDLLTQQNDHTVMYLGDEQQAIFSFMGAKTETLTALKLRCKDHIHHLLENHRSPSYLLDVFNDYAEKQLNFDRELLPKTDYKQDASADDLCILASNTNVSEVRDVVEKALSLYQADEKETTAVIVSSNADAEDISNEMNSKGLDHFKVSGRDLFDSPDVRLLLAHMNILANEHSFISWARILKGLKVFSTNALARRFLRKMKQLSIAPSDHLIYNNSTYVHEFAEAYDAGPIVVFDTETTGLDVFHDDIIEIAARRIVGGKEVGEPLDLYIETGKPILEKLGNKVNPMYAIYNEKKSQGQLLKPEKALRVFLGYVGNDAILGHNVSYDYHILDYNMRRYIGMPLDDIGLTYFDSLKLMRLLEPNLASYKLESLLKRFNLEGENSHQAIDDVGATVSLVRWCYDKAKEKVDAQMEFINHPKVLPFVRKLKAAYQELYLRHREQLYVLLDNTKLPLLETLQETYQYFIHNNYIDKVAKLDYVNRYLAMDMIIDKAVPNSLVDQLSKYMMDINTMKEADFCNSRSIRERVYVTTVHKAKGLEFDNVIVFDAVNGRYPSYYSKDENHIAEDARKLYVAMSRARKRLFIAYSLQSVDSRGGIHDHEITPFLKDILLYFN